jgi:hypothetical protein
MDSGPQTKGNAKANIYIVIMRKKKYLKASIYRVFINMTVDDL